MKKSATIAVLVGALSLLIVPSAGAGVVNSADRLEMHNLSVKNGVDAAFEVAKRECSVDATCLGYQSGPGCQKISRHSVTCPIHLVKGTPGDQAAQQDCHRTVQLKLKRRSFGIKFRFLNEYTCVPNTEHPGL